MIADLRSVSLICRRRVLPIMDVILTLPSLFIFQNKLIVLAALVASASAFAPASTKPAFSTKMAGKKVNWDDAAELGWSMGGEDYTRDLPPEVKHEDPRKAIPKDISFEEYMKQRAAEGN
jgi:hypothetical protein